MPLAPFATVMSEAVKPVTASLNAKVNTTSPVAVPLALSVIVTLGLVVSTVTVCVTAGPVLPATSEAVTDNEFVPFAFTERLPLAGLAEPVSIDHEPPVAVVE